MLWSSDDDDDDGDNDDDDDDDERVSEDAIEDVKNNTKKDVNDDVSENLDGDDVCKDLVEDELSLTIGPVFNDFGAPGSGPEPGSPKLEETVAAADPDPAKDATSAMRTWNLSNSKPVEAELVTVMAGQAVLKNQKGKTVKVPFDRLNEKDREFIELSIPPKFDINFTKNSTPL